LPSGIIYCTATRTKDVFPCIVEDIKAVFGLPRRGIHRVTLDGHNYLLYYTPITTDGAVIWETPLHRLGGRHVLRKDPSFRRNVQKIIAFCDILALCRTSEASIRIRPGSEGQFIPFSTNELATSIAKDSGYDYSILTKTLFGKWFGEDTSMSEIVKEMLDQCIGTSGIKQPIPLIAGVDDDRLAIVSAEIRTKVEAVIRHYDPNYIWYSNFIIDRMSRHLLTTL
jgi:hypothetical protein